MAGDMPLVDMGQSRTSNYMGCNSVKTDSRTPMDIKDARFLIDACDGIIFDNDGTLVDTMSVYYRGW